MASHLYHGDCLTVLKSLPSNFYHCTFADPPYGIDYQSHHTAKTARKPKIVNDMRPFIWWLYDAYRVTRENGCLLCCCRWDCAEVFRLAIEVAGFTIRSQVIWDRVGHGMGSLKDTFAPRHDTIWFATKGKFVFPGKRPKSVLRHSRLSGTNLVHPNEKPLDLLLDLLGSVVPAGGKVLDPMMGIGVTGQACHILGMEFTGIEIDSNYFQIASLKCNPPTSEAVA
jgi:DNA modification methylase